MSAIAAHTAHTITVPSGIKKFERWVRNKRIDHKGYYIPMIQWLLHLLPRSITLIIDGSTVGKKCVALMVSIQYKKRAIPLAWVVMKGKKGHFKESAHIDLIEYVHSILPDDKHITLLGDGEFDGIDFLNNIKGYGWNFVVRGTSSVKITSPYGETDKISKFIPRDPGAGMALYNMQYTEKSSVRLNVYCYWELGCEQPIILLSNLPHHEMLGQYKKRFLIETFFSDQKSRGFNIHKSKIIDPERLFRLLIVSCLAYVFVLNLAAFVARKKADYLFRRKRNDISMFKMGLLAFQQIIVRGLSWPMKLLLCQEGT